MSDEFDRILGDRSRAGVAKPALNYYPRLRLDFDRLKFIPGIPFIGTPARARQ